MLNIGIDFDNTIARHDTSLREVMLREGFIVGNWDGRGKAEIRDYLCRQHTGEITCVGTCSAHVSRGCRNLTILVQTVHFGYYEIG
jgi:hypothetical protein